MGASKYAHTLKVLGRVLGTDEGRRFFEKNGYRPGTPIVPAVESDPIGTTMSKGLEQGREFLIAVLIADELQVIRVADGDVSPESMTDRPGTVHVNSDIGMLYEAIRRDERGRRYHLIDRTPGPVGLFSRSGLIDA